MIKGQYSKLKELIDDADAVLVGASNGLSMADGYNIFSNNDWFRRNFGDMQQKYGFRSVLEGAFFPYHTLDEKWGFVSRLASRVYFDAAPGRSMRALHHLLKGKDVFVLTTNADDAFELAGFDPEQVFALEGGLGEMRCSAHCSNEVYKDLDALEKTAEAEENGIVPHDLIPRCSKCGAMMEPNQADSDDFFQTEFWKSRAAAFSEFARRHSGQQIVVIEIGVGPRNQMLLQPMRSLAASEPSATYSVLNLDAGTLPPALDNKTIALEGNIAASLEALAAA